MSTDVTSTVLDDAAPATHCPRCGAELQTGQSWCAECGIAARTRIVPTPNWRRPLVGATAIAVIAVIALMVAFFALTNNDNPLPTGTAPPAPAPAAASDPAASTPAASSPVSVTTAAPATTQPAITTAPTP